MTDFLGSGIGAFWLHNSITADGGYNYYGYVHRTGKVVIMREEIATSIIRYADGGFDLDTAWTNRASLDYLKIHLL